MFQTLHRRKVRIGITVAAVAALATAAFTVGNAVAGPNRVAAPEAEVNMTGKGLVSTAIATETSGTSISGTTTFTEVPGTDVTVTVPSGATRLASATFNAESNCYGTGTGVCYLRIVAKKAGTTTMVQFHPVSNFFFDTNMDPEGDYEFRSMQRSRALTAGTWRISVQRSVSNANTSGSLFSTHHRVDMFAR